jgi:hypothetical protein
MAAEPDDLEPKQAARIEAQHRRQASNGTSDDQSSQADDGDEDEDDDDVEEEPKLKYARLTSSLGTVYRNGDATSSFMAASDKMVRRIAVLELLPHVVQQTRC